MAPNNTALIENEIADLASISQRVHAREVSPIEIVGSFGRTSRRHPRAGNRPIHPTMEGHGKRTGRWSSGGRDKLRPPHAVGVWFCSER